MFTGTKIKQMLLSYHIDKNKSQKHFFRVME